MTIGSRVCNLEIIEGCEKEKGKKKKKKMGLLFGKSGGGSEHGSGGGAHRRQDMPVDQTSIVTQLGQGELELRRGKGATFQKHLKRSRRRTAY